MKMQSYKTIDEYVKTFPKEIREILEKIRKTVKSAAPNAEEAIRYGMPTYRLNGNLVHFAAYGTHIGFYPTPSGITAFKVELSPYITGKGTVRFPLDKSIPYDLIKKVVQFRVKENSSKSAVTKI